MQRVIDFTKVFYELQELIYGALVFLIPKILKLCGFLIVVWLWPYLVNVIPKMRRAH